MLTSNVNLGTHGRWPLCFRLHYLHTDELERRFDTLEHYRGDSVCPFKYAENNAQMFHTMSKRIARIFIDNFYIGSFNQIGN